MAQQLQSALTILRRKQVEARTGLSRSTIYNRVSRGEFPAPVNLGARAVGWLESDVDAWLAWRIAESREKAAPRPTATDVLDELDLWWDRR